MLLRPRLSHARTSPLSRCLSNSLTRRRATCDGGRSSAARCRRAHASHTHAPRLLAGAITDVLTRRRATCDGGGGGAARCRCAHASYTHGPRLLAGSYQMCLHAAALIARRLGRHEAAAPVLRPCLRVHAPRLSAERRCTGCARALSHPGRFIRSLSWQEHARMRPRAATLRALPRVHALFRAQTLPAPTIAQAAPASCGIVSMPSIRPPLRAMAESAQCVVPAPSHLTRAHAVPLGTGWQAASCLPLGRLVPHRSGTSMLSCYHARDRTGLTRGPFAQLPLAGTRHYTW